MNKKYIYKIQKNRPPYLFLDEITKLKTNKLCHAYLKLSKNKWFFKVHWPGDPNMPAFLQLEAMTQTCAIALLSKKDIKSKFIYILSVDNSRFYKKVTPGKILKIETKILNYKSGVANCAGKCMIDGKLASSANFKLLVPSEFMKK